MRSEVAPAAPPDAKLAAKNFQNSLFWSIPSIKIFLYVSLNAKFNAWVGKYLPRVQITLILRFTCEFGLLLALDFGSKI